MELGSFLRSLLAVVLCTGLIGAGMPSAHADMIRTDEYAHDMQRDAQLARVHDFLAEERVVAQLEALGVDSVDAAERVEALTAAELAALDRQLEDLPAGAADALTILGIIFLGVLILEILGVTNFFEV